MSMLNDYYEKGCNRAEYQTLVQMLNPFAPHMTEELWEMLGHNENLVYEPWPQYDEAKMVRDTIEMPVQINGRVKCTIEMAREIDKDAALEIALAEPRIAQAVEGKTIVKKIVVPGKIINIVVK